MCIRDRAGEVLQLDMKALCFEENDKLDVTEYTQAALVTTCLAMTRVAEDKGLKPNICLLYTSLRICTAQPGHAGSDACLLFVDKRGESLSLIHIFTAPSLFDKLIIA